MEQEAPSVGGTVRVTTEVLVAKPGPKRRGGGGDTIVRVARRCIVATQPDEGGSRISLVQYDLAPAPLARGGRGTKFMIAPMFNSVGVEVREIEVEVSEVVPLLAFEEGDGEDDTEDDHAKVKRYKDYGDQLFRLNDFTCAVAYYEAALRVVSSKFDDIGGTLIVNRKGHAVVAEVDYVEADEKNTSFDVTCTSSGEEVTITLKDVLLAIWAKDVSFLQTKILLNLCRCLLKLGDVDDTRGNASCVGERVSSAKNSRRERYRLAAVKGCSIAIALCEYHLSEGSCEPSSELNSLMEKARLVRSRAFLGMKKLPNATVDAKKVLGQNSTSREAQSLLADIKATQAYDKSMDKRLSKEVARWVHTATKSSNGAEAMGRMDDSVSEDERNEESDGDAEHVAEAAAQFDVDKWRIARRVSLEAAGVIAFLIAMYIIYPGSEL